MALDDSVWVWIKEMHAEAVRSWQRAESAAAESEQAADPANQEPE